MTIDPLGNCLDIIDFYQTVPEVEYADPCCPSDPGVTQ